MNLMLNIPTPEMAKLLGCRERNGPYQKRLVARFDRDIHDIVEQLDEPRLFTPTQQTLKLREQGGYCPKCKKPIEWGQKYEGHHIKPFSKGGPTILENLEVLHTECHREHHLKS
jgi:5-methylcytosine-specific restriction endonuclease McrA